MVFVSVRGGLVIFEHDFIPIVTYYILTSKQSD